MQLLTFASAAAMVATVSAYGEGPKQKMNALQLQDSFNPNQPYARIVNRCDYDVYLWSIIDAIGCNGMVTLKKGEAYHENYQMPIDGKGTSIKISKKPVCKGLDITQLEYYIEKNKPGFNGNYLDVSYVDCLGDDCPTMKEGYYLRAGDQLTKATTASANNKICPVLSCTDEASCKKISYVLPDDIQTRSCDTDQSMVFYMCGGDPPSSNDSAPASSSSAPSSKAAYSAPKPSIASPVVPKPSPIKSDAAYITSAPEVKEAKVPKVKTNVVYVTKYEYVNAKRHAHGHARRHQNFHA